MIQKISKSVQKQSSRFHGKKRVLFLLFLSAGIHFFYALPSIVQAQAASFSAVKYQPKASYLSPVKKAPMPFTGIGAKWHQVVPSETSAELWVRFFSNEGWSDWYYLEKNIDEGVEQPESHHSAFLATNQATLFQYKVLLKSENPKNTPLLQDLEFTYINAREKITVNSQDLISVQDFHVESSNTNNVSKKPRIISRSEWGADESLRIYKEGETEDRIAESDVGLYEKYGNDAKIIKKITKDDEGNRLIWPLEYPEKISKIVIHHTVSEGNLEDPEQAIRNIYYYHTKVKGWGDIGYNYIIDPNGNIYEGRYGGEGVVGTHAGKFNIGSIGIAVLGNYQEKQVPEAVLNSLRALIKEKTEKFQIDPVTETAFRGEKVQNIIGHRDAMKTACPGENLYKLLPELRIQVKTGYKPANSRPDSKPVSKPISGYDYKFMKITPSQLIIKPGQMKTMRLELKNTGKTTWKKTGKNKIMIGTENPRDHFSQLLMKPDARLGSLEEKEVKPGQIGHFSIKIKAPMQPGIYREEFAPVIEGITWLPFKQNYLEVLVTSEKYSARFLDEDSQFQFLPNEQNTLQLTFENTGAATWYKQGSQRISFEIKAENGLIITPAEMEQKKILPGQTAKVKFQVKAPASEGTYAFTFMPKIGSHALLPKAKDFTARVLKSSNSEQNNPPADNTKADQIRIGLGFHGNPVISANGKFTMMEKKKQLGTFLPNQKVSVTYEQGKFYVKTDQKAFVINSPPRFEPVGNSIVRIDNYENRPSWKPELNDNEYHGSLEIHWYNNELQVVNELHIEDYLKGLAEISANEPKAKIDAIIILARTYARYYMTRAEKFPGAPFHLSDDPARSQHYLGYGFEKRNPAGVKSVRDTHGLVVKYEGKVVKTPYSSSSGGKTLSAEAVWGWKDTPYLQSVDDPGCKNQAKNGHGVGASGCGLLYLAKLGQTYEQMIQYYYKDVKIQKY